MKKGETFKLRNGGSEVILSPLSDFHWKVLGGTAGFLEGDEVCGLGRAGDLLGLRDTRVFHADLADRAAIDRVVRETRPEAVYHLAAQSSPAESLNDPWATIGNNLQAQINLFEALLSTGARPRILGASSPYVHSR